MYLFRSKWRSLKLFFPCWYYRKKKKDLEFVLYFCTVPRALNKWWECSSVTSWSILCDLVFNFICKIRLMWFSCDWLVQAISWAWICKGRSKCLMNNGFTEQRKVNIRQHECDHVFKKNTTCCLNITFYFLDFYFCVLYYLGNMKKCKQLLQKAVECSAVPLGMLETALQNFHSQKKQLLSDEEKENFAGNCQFLNCWLGFCML